MLTQLINNREVHAQLFNSYREKQSVQVAFQLRVVLVIPPIESVVKNALGRQIEQKLYNCIKKIVIYEWEDNGSA